MLMFLCAFTPSHVESHKAVLGSQNTDKMMPLVVGDLRCRGNLGTAVGVADEEPEGVTRPAAVD